ncbi:MAG TPA: NADH-quinone oxidoreductase subunit J [Candidatus Elarobacter sp.]|nr:NADH-quinone oxidoreductase subunit J [Candidatus Elarobacter sp.]
MDNFGLFYQFHFYLFGFIAIASAITFITRRSPVAAAMWLIVTLFCLAALYVMLDAQFIGAMQVLVYAGAIMVVFLFVIMLLNLGHASEITDARGLGAKLLAGFAGLVLVAELGILSRTGLPAGRYLVPRNFVNDQVAKYGAVGAVAKPLYQDYSLAFELTSVLLLVAIAGAVMLGRRGDRDAR